jgi:hypothetical protein
MDQNLLSPKRKKDVWHREPWLILVLGGPLFVVCASLWTASIAIRGADQVVAKDYYRQGLMINTNIQRDEKARQMQLKGQLSLDLKAGLIQMQLAANTALPESVNLSLASSGKEEDSVDEIIRRLPLKQVSSGIYVGDLSQIQHFKNGSIKLLHVKLETNDWRLTGDWLAPESKPLELKPAS